MSELWAESEYRTVKTATITLTGPELDHLVNALSWADDQIYYGPKAQYAARSTRIFGKLYEAIKEISK